LSRGNVVTFDDAFTKLIGEEGGYVNNPADPGGETKYGISKRSYPEEDIANLTLARAKYLYARDFWGPAGCDAVPDGIKFDLFDTAVNSGWKRAVMLLQSAVNEVVDGDLGPHTLQAVQSIDPERLIARFNGWRLDFLNDNPTLWATFGRGWSQRIAENLKGA
jgi:lysozyme family protein